MKPVLFALILLPLAACIEAKEAVDDRDACGASGMQNLIGRELGPVLAATTFPIGTRIIAPDTAVTMDYGAERLNITHDKEQVITSVYCG